MKKYIAEFVGTLILALAVTISLAGTFAVPTPVIAGLALGIGVYTMGAISGAHFNPAITLGLLSIRKIGVKDALLYIAAQLIGAAVAMHLAKYLVTPAAVTVNDVWMTGVFEMIGTFVFAYGVASVAHGKNSAGASGLVVGGSLLLGISLAAAGSNAVLNPAVAFSIGSFGLFYLIGPIVGAVAAMWLYKVLAE